MAIASGALIAGLAAARGLTLGERSRAQPSAIASSAQAPVVAVQGSTPIAEPSELHPAVELGTDTEAPPRSAGAVTPTDKPESPRSDQVAVTMRDTGRATSAPADVTQRETTDENAEEANAQSATRRASTPAADALQTSAPGANMPGGVAPQAAAPQAAEPQAAAPQVQVDQMHEPAAPSVDGVASQAATPMHFERRFVAYVRCDGLPLGEGRFPCPRDPRLETQVWRVLAELEGCAIAAPARGQGELRLEFKRFGVPALHFEAVDHGALDVEAVSRCAGPSLSQLHTSLRPDHMVVAFRFELR
jgi:hypothetical protein